MSNPISFTPTVTNTANTTHTHFNEHSFLAFWQYGRPTPAELLPGLQELFSTPDTYRTTLHQRVVRAMSPDFYVHGRNMPKDLRNLEQIMEVRWQWLREGGNETFWKNGGGRREDLEEIMDCWAEIVTCVRMGLGGGYW